MLVLIAGCAGDSIDEASDGEADTAAYQAPGKADGAAFVGLYASTATHHYNNDIPALELRSDGAYVRSRCYHASCALQLPETDKFDSYTASSGKTYVRFWSFSVDVESDGLHTTPVIADVYEIKATSSGVSLRKSYTTRWFALHATTPAGRCAATGGTFDGTDCACPGVFAAGAGGCIATPGASEDGCDSSSGLWTDDDATPIGSFCECGVGRYDDASGACASI